MRTSGHKARRRGTLRAAGLGSLPRRRIGPSHHGLSPEGGSVPPLVSFSSPSPPTAARAPTPTCALLQPTPVLRNACGRPGRDTAMSAPTSGAPPSRPSRSAALNGGTSKLRQSWSKSPHTGRSSAVFGESRMRVWPKSPELWRIRVKCGIGAAASNSCEDVDGSRSRFGTACSGFLATSRAGGTHFLCKSEELGSWQRWPISEISSERPSPLSLRTEHRRPPDQAPMCRRSRKLARKRKHHAQIAAWCVQALIWTKMTMGCGDPLGCRVHMGCGDPVSGGDAVGCNDPMGYNDPWAKAPAAFLGQHRARARAPQRIHARAPQQIRIGRPPARHPSHVHALLPIGMTGVSGPHLWALPGCLALGIFGNLCAEPMARRVGSRCGIPTPKSGCSRISGNKSLEAGPAEAGGCSRDEVPRRRRRRSRAAPREASVCLSDTQLPQLSSQGVACRAASASLPRPASPPPLKRRKRSRATAAPPPAARATGRAVSPARVAPARLRASASRGANMARGRARLLWRCLGAESFQVQAGNKEDLLPARTHLCSVMAEAHGELLVPKTKTSTNWRCLDQSEQDRAPQIAKESSECATRKSSPLSITPKACYSLSSSVRSHSRSCATHSQNILVAAVPIRGFPTKQ